MVHLSPALVGYDTPVALSPRARHLTSLGHRVPAYLVVSDKFEVPEKDQWVVGRTEVLIHIFLLDF